MVFNRHTNHESLVPLQLTLSYCSDLEAPLVLVPFANSLFQLLIAVMLLPELVLGSQPSITGSDYLFRGQ